MNNIQNSKHVRHSFLDLLFYFLNLVNEHSKLYVTECFSLNNNRSEILPDNVENNINVSQ